MEEVRRLLKTHMPKRPIWYGTTSKPYIGCLTDGDGISPHLEEADDNSIIFPCVEMGHHDFVKICGDNTPSFFKQKPQNWEFFPGIKQKDQHKVWDGETFWITLCGFSKTDSTVYFVSDDLKNVYIFHVVVQTTYHLGRLKKDWEFTNYVLRKLRSAKLEKDQS